MFASQETKVETIFCAIFRQFYGNRNPVQSVRKCSYKIMLCVSDVDPQIDVVNKPCDCLTKSPGNRMPSKINKI